MKKVKKGDIVARKSHEKDIIFYVKRIIKTSSGEIAILTGLLERIEADSKIEDLEILDKKNRNYYLKRQEEKIKERIENKKQDYEIGIIESQEKRISNKIVTGKILHLDGDKRYSQKSYNYYKKLGLNAIVKNIPEYRQPKVVYQLLKIYNPDILIITGHDGMIKKGTNYNDIYNYRNSRHFINTVKEARRYDLENNKKTVIFAGACQSYFEALILAGANFASSPARILIDFLDPLIVAEKVATTEKYRYITIDDITKELREGKRGVDGIGANGKMTIL
ncbi:MAG: sporulation peptidase YabG [Clostridia bacterium]|jgi:spore coat assembly protein|nr:sporulation peptidase YabG [Clostridia bacterium]